MCSVVTGCKLHEHSCRLLLYNERHNWCSFGCLFSRCAGVVDHQPNLYITFSRGSTIFTCDQNLKYLQMVLFGWHGVQISLSLSLQTGWAVNSAISTLQLWFKLFAWLSLTYISVSINGSTLCDCCPSCHALGAVTRALMRTCKLTFEQFFLSHTRSFTIESLFFFSYNLLMALLIDTKSWNCLAVTRNTEQAPLYILLWARTR